MHQTHASMGPQLGGCGRMVENVTRYTVYGLQWGRSLGAAEGPSRPLHTGVGMHASMGPQLGGCGRERLRRARCGRSNSLQWGRSLGAAEGDPTTQVSTGSCSLQWGRSLGAAEGDFTAKPADPTWWLQWGRSLGAAEGRSTHTGIGPVLSRFNGAAAWGLRKVDHAQALPAVDLASMGPQLGGCGRRRRCALKCR